MRVWQVGLSCLVACFYAVFPSMAAAQQAEAGHPLAAVAPFVEQETFAIVRFDAMRLDLEGFWKQVEGAVPLEGADRAALVAGRMAAGGWLDQFRRAGGREIYVFVSLVGDWRQALFAVIPLAEGADAQGIQGLLPGMLPANAGKALAGAERVVWNGAIFIGPKEALARLKSADRAARTLPKEAFQAVAGAGVQLFVIPNDEQLRVLDEFLPGVLGEPAAAAGSSPRGMMEWLALGVHVAPQLSARLEIQSRDESAARAARLMIDALLKRIVDDEKVRTVVPKIERMARMVTPVVEGRRLVVSLEPEVTKDLLALLTETFKHAHDEALTQRSKNNLKMLALAMHTYHDVYSRFPPAAYRDKSGKPLLSWRVSLLPYLDQQELFNRFHLDEPWDSPHNKELIAKMPDVFAPRSAELRAAGKTQYVAPLGENTIFSAPEGLPIKEIIDGTSNTILIIEADEPQAVIWTRPDDLAVDVKDVRKAVFGARPHFGAAIADGAWRRFDASIGEEMLRAYLTYNGKEPIAQP